MIPSPLPEAVAVHQTWSLVTVQKELEVTLNVVVPDGDVTVWLGGVTFSVGAAPICVTVFVTEGTPVMEVVIVAMRVVDPGFSV